MVKNRVVLTRRGKDWHAYLFPCEGLWGQGHSPEDAIGEILGNHYERLGISPTVRTWLSVKREEIGRMILLDQSDMVVQSLGSDPELELVWPGPHVDYYNWITNPSETRLVPFSLN